MPPYFDTDIVYPVNVHLFIVSNGKKSESHNFLYMPQSSPINTLSKLSLTAITGPKAIQQAHGKPSHRDGKTLCRKSEKRLRECLVVSFRLKRNLKVFMNEIQEKETPEKMKQQPLSGHCNY